MKNYFVAQNGQQVGPFTLEELRSQIDSGRFSPGDYVWWEGAASWVRLDLVAELSGGPPPLQPSPSPLPPHVHTSGTAIASLVCGLLALVTGATGLLGLPLGVLALIRIRNGKGELKGSGLAIAGIACSTVGLLGVLLVAGMLLPAMGKAKEKAARIKCASNLKQIGLGFRLFANDNDDMYPWKTNKFPAATVNMPWQHFAAMSNELGSAKILMCPGDSQRLANMRMDFSTAPGSGFLEKQNAATSYTVGKEADETVPNVPLSHDRNVGRSESMNIRIAPYAEGLNEVKFDALWVSGTDGNAAHHGLSGNIVLSDGSVQQQTTAALQAAIRAGDESLRKSSRPNKQSISMLFP